ncbi:MAG: ester cyclase [Reyranella sp.]|nr:ester cyclase [Reyranella sp.]
MQNAARNKRHYLEAKEAFNRGDLDACLAYYAPDHRVRSQEVPPGRAQIAAFLKASRETWGDLRIVVEHVVAEDDWVMGHCRSVAHHTRPVMGIAPTGRRIEAAFWDLHRFDGAGLIVETWNLTDQPAVLAQLKAT